MLMRPSKTGRAAVPRSRRSTSPASFASAVCTVNSGVERMRTSRRRLFSGEFATGMGAGTGLRQGEGQVAGRNLRETGNGYVSAQS